MSTNNNNNIPIELNSNGTLNTTAMDNTYVSNIEVDSAQVTAVTTYLQNAGKKVLQSKATTLFMLESLKKVM